jgi:multicomponent K+:H+ antiporter subunit A
MDRHPLMLVVVTRVLLPLALVVSLYILLRGHNEPGGGFIAGLLVGIALVMQYMASGFAWADRRVRFDYHALIGAGVLLAGVTGMGAWYGDAPFLTSGYRYFHLPIVGEVELATAMAFDVGVFLTVVGVVMLSLANLARVGRKAEPQAEREGPMDIVLPAEPVAAAGGGAAAVGAAARAAPREA